MQNDLLQIGALVAAYVGVMKSIGVPSKYCPLLAVALSALFVMVPSGIEQQIVTISIIALTATGAYHYTKNVVNSSITDTQNTQVVPSIPVKEITQLVESQPTVNKPIVTQTDLNNKV
jgi:hypothetical protein